MNDSLAALARNAPATPRALLDSWLEAVRRMDPDAIAGHYAPELVAFDAFRQLRFQGVAAYREHWAFCLSACPGPIVFELRDLVLSAGADLAYGHFLCRCGFVDETGRETGSWMRVSVGLRRGEDGWRIAHEHFSLPIDMETGRAMFAEEP